MTSKSLHKKITINATANFFRYVIYIVITFALTPFIIRHLGNSQYGLWVVILSVIGYSGLLEMGIQTAIIKLVAHYNGAGDIQKINEIITTALAFFVTVGTITAMICWFVLPYNLKFFLNDANEILLAKQLLLVLGFNMSFIFIGYVFGGMLYGLQMYHVKGIIDVLSQIINALLILIFFTKGYGLFAMAKIKVFVDLISVCLVYLLCVKSYPKLSIRLYNLNKEAFCELFSIGGKIFTSTTLARITTNIEPFIITYYLTTAWTAIYSIPKRLIDYLREIVWSLSTGFMPTFSELHGQNSLDLIRSIYVRYTKYIIIIMFPIIVSAIVYGVPFVRLWVGPEFASKGSFALILLTVSFYVECSQPLLGRLLVAVDKINVFAKISSLSSISYIVLCSYFVYRYGIAGAALSALVVSFCSQLYYLKCACKYLNMPIRSYFTKCYMTPFVISFAYGLLIYLLSMKFTINSYVDIIVQLLVAYLMYIVAIFAVSLDSDEKNYLKLKLRTMFNIAQFNTNTK